MHEILLFTESMRTFCLGSVAADLVRAQGQKEGMRLIVQDGLEKVKMGITTVREVLGGTE